MSSETKPTKPKNHNDTARMHAIFCSPAGYSDWKSDMKDYSHNKTHLRWNKLEPINYITQRDVKRRERDFDPVNQCFVNKKRVTQPPLLIRRKINTRSQPASQLAQSSPKKR